VASEGQLNITLNIRKGNLIVPIQETFRFDVTGQNGPSPGAVTATTAGTDVDLSQLTTFGKCVIKNLDPVNYVEVGIWDPETLKFYPFAELAPGEPLLVTLSRNFGVEYEDTGTGTSPATNRLRIKANTASCNVQVLAYER
jgi:hypothetical protein